MKGKSSAGRIIVSVVTWIVVAVCALAGIAAAAAGVYIGVRYHDAKPILLAKPEAATAKLTQMMEHICDGDFSAASGYMLGKPSLGADSAPEDELTVLLWDAWKESMSYELVGDCHTTYSGLAQDISVTYLDVSSVTANLRADSEALLEQRVAEATDVSQIYDANNEYREDIVMDVLCDTAVAALNKDAKYTTVTLTVNMTYQDGQWWILAEEPLLNAISGSVLYG